MVRFEGGPADNVTLALHRVPVLLRVVVGPRGKIDTLDALEDEAKASETIHVYRRVWSMGLVHILRSPRAGSGYFAVARYAHMRIPANECERLRDTAAWRAWATAAAAAPLARLPHDGDEIVGRCSACGDLSPLYDAANDQWDEAPEQWVCGPCVLMDFGDHG